MTWHVFAFEGFTGHAADALRFSSPFVRNHWLPLLSERFPPCEVHYLSEGRRGVRTAADAVLATGSDGRPGATDRFVLLGYSNGGHAAIQAAEQVGKRGIQIRLGFSADPIPKRLGFLTPFAGRLAKPPNVERWVSFYQRNDRGSFASMAPLWGHPVVRADENVRIDSLPGKSHLKLPGYPPLLERLCAELKDAGVPSE